jgi:hypothetical protein
MTNNFRFDRENALQAIKVLSCGHLRTFDVRVSKAREGYTK